MVGVAMAGCGGHSGASPSVAPSTQRVTDAEARRLLLRAFDAARTLGREDGLCRGCYPDDTDEITEDMNGITGDPYAIAFTAFGARMRGVVYVDTVGADRLTNTHFTAYARTSNGTIWMLSAGRGRPHLTVAE
jgi:hypothetical protein